MVRRAGKGNTAVKKPESSSAGEFHPHALTEPDVNLSIHPALIVQPLLNGFALSTPVLPFRIVFVLGTQAAWVLAYRAGCEECGSGTGKTELGVRNRLQAERRDITAARRGRFRRLSSCRRRALPMELQACAPVRNKRRRIPAGGSASRDRRLLPHQARPQAFRIRVP